MFQENCDLLLYADDSCLVHQHRGVLEMEQKRNENHSNVFDWFADNRLSILFFSIWVLLREQSRFTGQYGKRETISLTPHYHFYLLHRRLDISRTIFFRGRQDKKYTVWHKRRTRGSAVLIVDMTIYFKQCHAISNLVGH